MTGMRKPIIALTFLVVLGCLALISAFQPAQAADTRLFTVDVSTQSATSANFECGGQLALRAMTMDGGTAPDVSYRICDTLDYTVGADGGTCVALVTDMRLSANVTYDIGVPQRSSSSAQCRVAFITQTGSGVVHGYAVKPRTIPETP